MTYTMANGAEQLWLPLSPLTDDEVIRQLREAAARDEEEYQKELLRNQINDALNRRD